MKTARTVALTVAVVAAAMASQAQAQDRDALIAEARSLAAAFGASLKQALIGALDAGDPEEAVVVCRLLAPALANEQGQASGWRLGRTSLRIRNPKNAPDDWERRVLADFETRKARGEDVRALEHAQIVTEADRPVFRYMKAIPTAKLCLTCHGTALPAPLAAKLEELYPDDRARGFDIGDLRGAFTLSRPL